MRLGAKSAVLTLLIAVATAGCGEPADYSVPPERPSCPAAPTTVDLGVPFGESRISLFATKGGVVHFEVSGINQGGIFDMNRTVLSVGPVVLPAGSYWVGSSSGGHVLVTSCRPGGVTPAS